MNPAALAALSQAGTGFLQRYGKWIGVAAVLLVLWFLFRSYIRVLFGLVPDDAQLQAGDGDVYRSFYEQRGDISRRLEQGLSKSWLEELPWFGGNDLRCDVLYEAIQWNNNQLRVIHNAYKNRTGQTLYADLSSLATDACGGLFGDGLDEGLSNRLKTLGLV